MLGFLLAGCGGEAAPPYAPLLREAGRLGVEIPACAAHAEAPGVESGYAVLVGPDGVFRHGALGDFPDGPSVDGTSLVDGDCREVHRALVRLRQAYEEAAAPSGPRDPTRVLPLPLVVLCDARAPWACLARVLRVARDAGAARVLVLVREEEDGRLRSLAWTPPRPSSPPPGYGRPGASTWVRWVATAVEGGERVRHHLLGRATTDGAPPRVLEREVLGTTGAAFLTDWLEAVAEEARAKIDRPWIRLTVGAEPEASEAVSTADVLPLFAAALASGADEVFVDSDVVPMPLFAPRSVLTETRAWEALHPPAVRGAHPLAERWLVAHAEPDGHLADPDLPGRDLGLTALAALALLGGDRAGTDRTEGDLCVHRALAWLGARLRPDGTFADEGCRPGSFDHAMAALALIAAWRAWPDASRFEAARTALGPFVRAAEREDVVGGVAVLPLLAARAADLEALARGEAPFLAIGSSRDPAVRRWAEGVLEEGVDTDLAALALLALGEEPQRSPPLLRAVERLRAHPPLEGTDPRHVLFGSLVVYLAGGQAWKVWNDAPKIRVVDTQRHDGVGPPDASLGRVGTTSLLAMVLQLYYAWDSACGVPLPPVPAALRRLLVPQSDGR